MSVPDEETNNLDQMNWLDRMKGFLEWQIVYPKPSNPFGKKLSDAVLQELAEDIDALYKHIKLRCVSHGDEFVLLSGLHPSGPKHLKIDTDHPNISVLVKSDFHGFFARSGMYNWLNEELQKIQESYREEINLRKAEKRKAGRSRD